MCIRDRDMVVSINSGVDVDISDVDDDADKKSFSFTEGGVEDDPYKCIFTVLCDT